MEGKDRIMSDLTTDSSLVQLESDMRDVHAILGRIESRINRIDAQLADFISKLKLAGAPSSAPAPRPH